MFRIRKVVVSLISGWAKHEVNSGHHTCHTIVFLEEDDQDHGTERHNEFVVTLGEAD